MSMIPKELIKEYIKNENFTSTTDIIFAMKELFKDVLRQVMECELDTTLGYEKSQRLSKSVDEQKPRNYRNGYSHKTIKTRLGEIEIQVSEIVMAIMNFESLGNMIVMLPAWKIKFFPSMLAV